MKKFLVILTSIIFTINSVNAEPIVELAAPRIQAPRVVSEGPSNGSINATAQQKQAKTTHKKHKKVHKKKKLVTLNYDNVSKLIENGYYDSADAQIQNVMTQNPKDINAPVLWVVSQAKQGNIDSAQNRLNILIKKYPKNSDLFYASGVIDYKKATNPDADTANQQALISSAFDKFKKAIQLDKSNAKAYNAAGVVTLNIGDANSAKDYFSKALAADKTYSSAIDNLGTIDYTNGDLDAANTKFKKALVFNQQNPTAMYHIAQVSYKKQDYPTAIKYLNKAIALNPSSAAFYNLKGKNYAAIGNDAKAINSFKKSIELKPDSILSYMDLATLYAKRGDNEFAMEELKTVLSLNPDMYNAKLKLADLSFSTGKYPQAIALYSELVSMDEYKNASLIGLANSYWGQAQLSANKSALGSNKNLFNALEFINQAIQTDNNNLELHLAKLKLTKLTNQPELTKIELNKIIQSQNNDLMTNLLKGEAYITLNDYENAQKAFDNAISRAKNLDDNLYLAEILLYQKQFNDAEKVLKKILKNYPQNQQATNGIDYIKKNRKLADNYFESAKTFIKTKNNTVAIEYLNRSVATDPNNSQVRLILAELYEKQRDYQDAIANYEAYVGLNPDSSNCKRIIKKIQKLENRL